MDFVRWVSRRFSRHPVTEESEFWDRIHTLVTRHKDFATSVIGLWINLFVAISSSVVLCGLWLYLKTEDVNYAMPGSLDDIEDRMVYVDFFAGPIEAYTGIEKPSLRAIQWASREALSVEPKAPYVDASDNGPLVLSRESNEHRKAWSKFLLGCFATWVVLPRWLSLVLFGISARGSSKDPMPTREQVRILVNLARQEASVLPVRVREANDAGTGRLDVDIAANNRPTVEIPNSSDLFQAMPVEEQDNEIGRPTTSGLDEPQRLEGFSKSSAVDHSLNGCALSIEAAEARHQNQAADHEFLAPEPATINALLPSPSLPLPPTLAEKLKGAIESAKQKFPVKTFTDEIASQTVVLAGFKLNEESYGWVEKLAAKLRLATFSRNILCLDDENEFLHSFQSSNQVVLVASLANTADDDYREFLGDIVKRTNPMVIITDGVKQLLLTGSNTADRTTALRGWKEMTARGGVPNSAVHIHDICNEEGSNVLAKLLQGKLAGSLDSQLHLAGRYETAGKCISEAIEAKGIPQVELIDQLSESLASLYSPEREKMLGRIQMASGIEFLPNATTVRDIVDNVANFDAKALASLSLAQAVKSVMGTWLSGVPMGWAVAGGIAGLGAVTVTGVAALALGSPAAIAILPGLVWGSPIAGLTGAAVSASAKKWLIGSKNPGSMLADSDPATSMLVAKTGILQSLVYELRGNPDAQLQAVISEVTSELDRSNVSDESLLVKAFIEKMRSLEAKS